MDAFSFLDERIAPPNKKPANTVDDILGPEKKPDVDTFLDSKPKEFNLDLDRIPWIKKHPNLYGLYGAAKETSKVIPFSKYIHPEERDRFMALDKQHQIRDLLMEDLGLALWAQWKPIATGVKNVVSPLVKTFFPKTFKTLTSPLRLTKKGKLSSPANDVKKMVKERGAEIDKGMLEAAKFRANLENELTVKELEALPFLRQGIKDPSVLAKIGKEDLVSIIENPSPKLLKNAESVGKYYDDSFKFLKDHWEDPQFVKDYVTQIWDIPKNKVGDAVRYFQTKNPFLSKRKIPTLEEGIKLGLTPKTTNISKILKVYDNFKVKTAFNNEFAQGLVGLTDGAGKPLVMRIDKAPADWIKIDHPALNRAKAVGKTTQRMSHKETTKTITETLEKLKTIERTIPSESVVGDVGGRIKSLEGVISGALESRGMTSGESSNYLNRLKSAYAGKGTAPGEASETITNTVNKKVSQVISEVNRDYPINIPILQKVPVKVHPDIARDVKVVFDDPFHHPAIRAMEVLNAFTKKGMLSLSLFHHQALTESAFATGVGRKAVLSWNPYRVYRALQKKDYAIFKEMNLAFDGIDAGVKFGALEDVHRSAVQRTLMSIENTTKNIPGINRVTWGIRKGNDLWDQALWDYYHNTLKLYAYEENVGQMLKSAGKIAKKKGKPLSPDEITRVKSAAAEFTNDSFGGQNWDLMPVLGNPKNRQMMHWGILAPDWTISTLKQAIAPLRGATKIIQGDKVVGWPLLKQGTKFWVKAGMYFNLIAQSVNYHKTKRDYGKGRFTWDNAPGHELNVYMGKNEDGTERYLRMGKQFREVLEWGENPLNKVGGKIAPIAGELIRQVSKHDPGSGFPTEFAEGDEFWSRRSLQARAKSIALMPVPFSLRPYITDRPKNFMFTFPTSKGMTNYKTVDLFKASLKKKDIPEIKRIYISALQNNLDAKSLFSSARSAVKADFTYDNKSVALDIFKELRSLDDVARADALIMYKNKGILKPEVMRQLKKLYEKEDNIKAQKTLFGIE